MKRKRGGEDEEDEDDDLPFDVPRDTMLALNLILSQFPKISVPPFVLRTQLYSSISDRTSVDRELEAMKQERGVRIFKLNSGQDDFAVMLYSDFIDQIRAAKQRMESKHDMSVTAALGWFESFVVTSQTDVSISDQVLVELLSRGGPVTDKHVTLLINAGLLVRQLAESTHYWFSIPGIGSVLKSITQQGRKELLQILNKRPYKEILQSQLEKRKLRSSSLGVRFHIRDLLGSSQISSFQTTSGTLLRITKQ